jgi:hypothetical protein
VSYTKPELRDRLKEEILSSSTAGTAAGKWSARKALLLAKRYKAKGGGYSGSRTEKQKELKNWADKH